MRPLDYQRTVAVNLALPVEIFALPSTAEWARQFEALGLYPQLLRMWIGPVLSVIPTSDYRMPRGSQRNRRADRALTCTRTSWPSG
jgi:hypothetical protein